MHIKEAVTAFGTSAVVEFRKWAAIRDETSIPEPCLSLHIASHMITECQWDARVEVPYTRMLSELGAHGSDIVPKFGANEPT